jgi:hypothetical protein
MDEVFGRDTASSLRQNGSLMAIEKNVQENDTIE